MNLGDLVHSLYDNPVTRGLASSVVKAGSAVMGSQQKKPVEVTLWKLTERQHQYIRLAGVFGASAVILGAYGAHTFNKQAKSDELKVAFETANRYHFLHTIPLLALPLVRRPHLVGTLMISGMTIFCGTCYAYAFTGNPTVRQFTPYGGTLLIFGWLAMLL
ncbi:transmembrane protein 256 homolog [Ischnura elegans]|uniref:transmembrane protein 256 homolog n=1 Tax=Ischnura elegans TaxID=197161 RepID=UPI001ED866D9|nr:transmembrane protein 256 homolog [Ischnura elegans]